MAANELFYGIKRFNGTFYRLWLIQFHVIFVKQFNLQYIGIMTKNESRVIFDVHAFININRR